MNKTYCFTDIHGVKTFWEEIKDLMDETDKAYCLGDCLDRGANGYAIAKEILADPRITYIKGNHEDLFVKSARKSLRLSENDFAYTEEFNWHIDNGGWPTEMDWLYDGRPVDIVDALDNLPYYAYYTNKNNQKIFLSHAGLEYPVIESNPLDNDTKEELLWNRFHMYDEWPNCDTDIMIHGHTPMQFLDPDLNASIDLEPFIYCDWHKIDLDTGGYYSNQFLVLDLDTFDWVQIINFS